MIDRIVLDIPHSSSEFPGFAKANWEPGIDEHIQRWTDWGTNHLFGMPSLKDPRIHPVVFPWSRFFCDVKRLENDTLEKMYNLTILALVGSGDRQSCLFIPLSFQTILDNGARPLCAAWRLTPPTS